MTYPNGDEYTGEWKDNAMEGEGTYVYKVLISVIQRSVPILTCRSRRLSEYYLVSGLSVCILQRTIAV